MATFSMGEGTHAVPMAMHRRHRARLVRGGFGASGLPSERRSLSERLAAAALSEILPLHAPGGEAAAILNLDI